MFLARTARKLGAAAASAFGAGFGGAVWALVASAAADEFLRDWANSYAESLPERAGGAEFLLTAAGPAAFELA